MLYVHITAGDAALTNVGGKTNYFHDFGHAVSKTTFSPFLNLGMSSACS